MSLEEQGSCSSAFEIDLENLTIEVKGKKVDLAILAYICNPDRRILWRFMEVDGVVRAVPYNEKQVIWIDEAGSEREGFEMAQDKG